MSDKKWLTPEQVAQDPRLPRATGDWVRKMLRKGHLRGAQLNGRWYVEETAIGEMFETATNDTRKRRRRAS